MSFIKSSISFFNSLSEPHIILSINCSDRYVIVCKHLKNVNPKYNKLGKNSIGCRRLPHGKFQYQVHLKKDVHQHISKQERESLWAYLERNENDCLVSNKYVLDYLIGKYPHCYHGYFYVSEQKMLTPIFMLAQGAIDKVIKYVQVKNAGNKKVKRT